MQISRSDGWGALLDAVESTDKIHDTFSFTDQVWDLLADNGYVIVKANEKKLIPAQVRAIRAKHKMGDSQAELAQFYGVNPATISRIVRGEYW